MTEDEEAELRVLFHGAFKAAWNEALLGQTWQHERMEKAFARWWHVHRPIRITPSLTLMPRTNNAGLASFGETDT